MMPTQRQRHLLAHLGEVKAARSRGQRLTYRLDDEDFSDAITALVDRGMLIRRNGGTRLQPTAVAEMFLAHRG